MTKDDQPPPRGTTIPYVDFRERWPVDFSAAADTPDPWSEDAAIAADRRDFRASLLLALVGGGIILAAFILAFAGLADVLPELAPLARAAEQPVNP